MRQNCDETAECIRDRLPTRRVDVVVTVPHRLWTRWGWARVVLLYWFAMKMMCCSITWILNVCCLVPAFFDSTLSSLSRNSQYGSAEGHAGPIRHQDLGFTSWVYAYPTVGRRRPFRIIEWGLRQRRRTWLWALELNLTGCWNLGLGISSCWEILAEFFPNWKSLIIHSGRWDSV